MKVAFLVDLHSSQGDWPTRLRPEATQGADLILLGGDLTNFGGVAVARRVVEQARQLSPAVLAVAGNCDRLEVESWLEGEGIGLDRQTVTVDGLRLLGLSAGLPFGGCPYERSEEEFEAALAQLAPGPAPTVLVSHQPPYGTRCDLVGGRHVGSVAVRAGIERLAPDLVLCGHIHEGIGWDRVGSSLVVNPGPAFHGRSLRFEVREGRLENLMMLPEGERVPTA